MSLFHPVDSRTQEVKMMELFSKHVGHWIPTYEFRKLGILDHRTLKSRCVKKGYVIETKTEDKKNKKGQITERHAFYKFTGATHLPIKRKIPAHVNVTVPVPHGSSLSEHIYFSVVAYCVVNGLSPSLMMLADKKHEKGIIDFILNTQPGHS